MLRRARMTVAYDGAPFRGFAEQRDQPTVLAVLSAAIETVVQRDVALSGAGRTDAGVHAWGQVVSADLPESVDLAALVHRINRLCAPSVAVRDAAWTLDAGFDARFSALWRRYRYLVLNDPRPNPLLAATTWHVPAALDLAAMRLSCDPLIGEHDFASFCRRPRLAADRAAPSLVRRVFEASWRRLPHDQSDALLRFEIRANAFCHQMVRSIVGTLVDVGRGRLHAGDVGAILRAGSRDAAGAVAPPHALCLWEVGYPAER